MDCSSLYGGENYHDYPNIKAWCEWLAEKYSNWITLSVYGLSREQRPLLMLTLNVHGQAPTSKPAFWLDGGTHASEWAGVMSTLYTISRWIERLEAGDQQLHAELMDQTIYIVPCISPDGFQHLMEGGAFVRSTLRPPPPGGLRVGLQPSDVDGDGPPLSA